MEVVVVQVIDLVQLGKAVGEPLAEGRETAM